MSSRPADYYNFCFSHNNEQFVFPLHLNSESEWHNAEQLFYRPRGVHLYVDDDGRLQKVSDIFSQITSFFQGQAKVREVIAKTLEEFKVYYDRYGDEKVARAVAEHFFSPNEGSIGRLSSQVYDRDYVKNNSKLSKYLSIIRIRLDQDHDFCFETEKMDGFSLDLPLGEEALQFLNGDPFVETAGEVQKKANTIIDRLEKHLQTVQITKAHKVAINKIFKESGFTKLSRDDFNRGAIKEGSAIEKILMPEFEETRAQLKVAFEKARKNDTKSLMALEKATKKHLYQEFLFAQSLGIDLEENKDGGSGGARYARDRYGRKIFVIKPNDEGPNQIHNPNKFAWVKSLFISARGCLENNSEALAEYLSYLFDRKFELFVVPPTMMRYVHSTKFNGNHDKLCSVQMYVKGCDPIEKLLGPKWKHRLPRSFLPDMLANLGTEIPQELIERCAIIDFATENIDCHFQNILYKIHKNHNPTTVDKILEGKGVDVAAFVNSFIEHEGNQLVLDSLLSSAINASGQKVTLVKHDGGSSLPHEHSGGYLSTRFKHLFEVLFHFLEKFGKSKNLLKTDLCKTSCGQCGACSSGQKTRDVLESLLLAQAVFSLRVILDKEVFEKFWISKIKNNETGVEVSFRQLFRQYIFDFQKTSSEERDTYLIPLIAELTKHANVPPGEMRHYLRYFNRHLKRIKGCTKTRIDSFRVMAAHMKKPDVPMRFLFRDVRSKQGFVRELASLNNDGFDSILEGWMKKHVPDGIKTTDYTDLTSTDLLFDMGVVN